MLRNVTIKALTGGAAKHLEVGRWVASTNKRGNWHMIWSSNYARWERVTANEQMVQDADLFRRYNDVTLSQYLPVTPTNAQTTIGTIRPASNANEPAYQHVGLAYHRVEVSFRQAYQADLSERSFIRQQKGSFLEEGPFCLT